MTGRPEPKDEQALRSSYASFLSRLEAGEELEFEAWAREAATDAEALEALRSLHADCAALEATLDRLAAEHPLETLFFQPPSPEAPAERAAREALRPEPGLRIGDYRLISRLGKGGMGEVWEAVHFGLQRRVALKLLDPERFTERGVRFFDREARAGARVHDPGIVAVHAAGESDGFLWIDQELVEGGRTLADFLREMRARPALPEDYDHRVARFVADVARSMHVAHERFVVHRDLKPGNILIGPGDRPKITDFGLARLTDEQSVSRSGDLVGTYQYMSPEQITRGKHRADHRTDVFSLGVVLYELLTLQRPFEADSTQELVARILHHREPDPASVRADVPRELGTICVRALQKSPADRFGSMVEFADELERWLGGLPIRTRRPGMATSLALWCRRHPTFAAALLVALVAIVPLVGVTLRLGAVERRSRYAEAVGAIRLAGIGANLDGVHAALRTAQEIDADEPQALLVAAVGALLCKDVAGAEALLARALALGFDPQELRTDDAEDQYLLGYSYLLHEDTPESHELARAAFERVLELAGEHRGALFGLYALSLAQRDVAAAARWLERYRGRLENDDPANVVVEALALELAGDNVRALACLQAVLADPEREPEELRTLRVRRLVGRMALLAGEPELAVEALRAAVADFQDDEASWSNLSVAAYVASAGKGAVEREALLATSRAAAERCCELGPHRVAGRWMLAVLDLAELERELNQSVRIEPERWRELEAQLDELEVAGLDPVLLSEARSEGCYLQGFDARLAGDVRAAIAQFERALDADPENVRAHLFLAQNLVEVSGVEELERVREHLELGLAAFERAREPHASWAGDPYLRRRFEPRFEASFQTWIAWAAAEQGDVDRALAARDAVEALLADGPLPEPSELLTYAEGLAALPGEFAAEHDRGREIVLRYELEKHFGASPEGRAILARIAAAGR